MIWAHELLHVGWLGKVSVLDQPYVKDEYYSRYAVYHIALSTSTSTYMNYSNPNFQVYRALDAKWLAFSELTPGYGPANK